MYRTSTPGQSEPNAQYFFKKFDHKILDVHCKKKVREFPVPSRDVTTKLSLGGNNDVITELFLPGGVWLVTSRLETGNSWTFFTV
jgi:hypothetical protein